MKSSTKENKGVLYLLIIAVFLQLLILYFFKYQNQNLSVLNLNLKVTGNLFNLIIYLLSEILLIFALFNYKVKLQLKLLSILIVLSYFFLLFGYISTKINLPFNSIYIFGQFGNKLFTGLCYTIYQLLFFTFVIVLVLNLRKNQNRIFIKSFFLSIIIMLAFLTYSFLFIASHEEKVKLQPLDKKNFYNIVVLGAAVWSDNKPSPILAARVDKAIDLIKNFNVEKVYFTGSNAPGELSEAEVALNYLKSKNISADNVITETNTTSTTEQIQFIKNKIGHEPKKKIIIISDSFHLVRIKEISKFHHLNIITIASELELNFFSELYNKLRESLALTVFWFFAI
ncbi:MAG: YdcF family protein [Ignavibacterium sp.]